MVAGLAPGGALLSVYELPAHYEESIGTSRADLTSGDPALVATCLGRSSDGANRRA